MGYRHLSIYERGRIEELTRLGFTKREIARKLNRAPSTTCREVRKTLGKKGYDGKEAQACYEKHRKYSTWSGKWTKELSERIADALLLTWSPEQIAHTVTKGEVSSKTIYIWTYEKKIPDVSLENLRHKGKQRKRDQRSVFSIGRPISERPEEVKNRENFGHWELDTMVSSRGESKGCFATFVERKTRLYTALKIEDRTAESMEKAIKNLYTTLPIGAFKTATTDRGKEFACAKIIESELGVPVYFADAYSPWQRGSNENSNGLLREFFPKKTDLSTVSEKELVDTLFLINSRPRKCLHWSSPIDLFLSQLLHLT